MKNDDILKIKDSIDLFTENDTVLVVYYMNTRQKKLFHINPQAIKVLELINGKRSLTEILDLAQKKINLDMDTIRSFINQLYEKRILTKRIDQNIISKEAALRYYRQINYFSEFFPSEENAFKAQKKVMDSQVVLFGCGSMGGNLAIQLAMAGVSKFILFDEDKVGQSDIARHIYFDTDDVGKYKVNSLEKYLRRINHNIQVDKITQKLLPQTDVSDLIKNATFVINTADEPYIGYTAARISRICVKTHTPLYIAGGFDAHLASTGEIIIPGITPCADCYATYFHEALKGWQPEKYPERSISENEMGGLASMTLFSSSFASVEIIKYIAGLLPISKYFKTRGELMFEDFSLKYIKATRNPKCQICAGVKYESKN